MTNEKMARCETRKPGGDPCINTGTFLVGVGQRKSDRQLACAHHVAGTIITMAGSENKPTPQITVTWHPNGVPKWMRGKEDW